MQRTYKNKYGTLTIEDTGELMHVSQVKWANVPNELKFDIETGEKIALITENENLQQSYGFPIQGNGYLMRHESPSTVYLCKIVLIDFTSTVNPSVELDRLVHRQLR